MNITLTVGDYWDDGHGKHRNIVFETNATQEDILQAYEDGCRKIGYPIKTMDLETSGGVVFKDGIASDVMQFVANEYESQAIPVALAEKMIEAGFTVATWNGTSWDHEEDERDLYCYEDEFNVDGPEDFAKLWMRIAKLGLPELEYSLVEEDVIEIGGYGCFH